MVAKFFPPFHTYGMEQLWIELAKAGLLGVVAYLFYRLYIDEKKAHEVTRQALINSLLDRIKDSKETVIKVTEPLGEISQGIKGISGKIEASRNDGGR